jgi:uncharacterized protein (DUF1330 family)
VLRQDVGPPDRRYSVVDLHLTGRKNTGRSRRGRESAMSSVFFVATIRIHDHARYQRYLDAYDEAFAGIGGEVLAVDDAPVRLEGSPLPGRIVLIRFPDRAAFDSWYGSAAYRRIVVHRHAASETDALLVRGR